MIVYLAEYIADTDTGAYTIIDVFYKSEDAETCIAEHRLMKQKEHEKENEGVDKKYVYQFGEFMDWRVRPRMIK